MESYLLALMVAQQFEASLPKAMDLALALHTWAEEQSDRLPDSEIQRRSRKALRQ